MALTDAQQLDMYKDIQDIRGSTAIRDPVTADAVRTIIGQALAGLTVPAPSVDFTTVLAAVADLKAHPVVASDPTLAAKIDALTQPIAALGKHLGVGTP